MPECCPAAPSSPAWIMFEPFLLTREAAGCVPRGRPAATGAFRNRPSTNCWRGAHGGRQRCSPEPGRSASARWLPIRRHSRDRRHRGHLARGCRDPRTRRTAAGYPGPGQAAAIQGVARAAPRQDRRAASPSCGDLRLAPVLSGRLASQNCSGVDCRTPLPAPAARPPLPTMFTRAGRSGTARATLA